jgi:hypothetical protein
MKYRRYAHVNTICAGACQEHNHNKSIAYRLCTSWLPPPENFKPRAGPSAAADV